MKIFIIAMSLLTVLLVGYCYFTSDYTNTDYYKPSKKLILTQGENLALYPDSTNCYLHKNPLEVVDPNFTPVEILQFQRDLRDGSACFKVRVKGKIGYIADSSEHQLDGSKILDRGNSDFQKAYWPNL